MTIATVSDRMRPWDGPNGTVHYIEGTFSDGTLWSSGAKPDFSQKRLDELKSLVGIAGDYELQAAGEYQGSKKWKMISWPGKPMAGGKPGFGGGAKAPYQPRHRDTPEGTREERESIHRSVALQQAVTFTANHVVPDEISPERVTKVADSFYDWLVGPQRSAPASVPQIQAQAKQVQQELPVNRPSGGNECPNCGKKEAVRKSRYDDGHPWYCYKKIGGCGHQWGGPVKEEIPSIQVGPTPSGSKSTAYKASEAIAQAVKNKNLAELERMAAAVKDRWEEGKISNQEKAELDIEAETGRMAINAGESYSDWFNRKVAEVQAMELEQVTTPEMREIAERF